MHSYAFATFFIAAVAARSQAPADAREIVNRVLATQTAHEADRARYTYAEHASIFVWTAKSITQWTTNGSRWKTSPYRRLVVFDGKPLRAKQAKEEEDRFKMTRAERRAADSTRKPNPRYLTAGVDLAAIAQLMQYSISGEESLNDRPTWILQCEPKSDPPPSLTAKERETLAYRVTLWVDQQDFAVAQKSWETFREGAQVLAGSHSLEVYQRVAPSVWLPKIVDGEYYSGPPHSKSHWRQTHRFTNFKKFGAEATVSFSPDAKN